MEGLVENRDGMRSCAASPFHVGGEEGLGVVTVRKAGAKAAKPYSGSIGSVGVAYGGVASLVNHMGYVLRT